MKTNKKLLAALLAAGLAISGNAFADSLSNAQTAADKVSSKLSELQDYCSRLQNASGILGDEETSSGASELCDKLSTQSTKFEDLKAAVFGTTDDSDDTSSDDYDTDSSDGSSSSYSSGDDYYEGSGMDSPPPRQQAGPGAGGPGARKAAPDGRPGQEPQLGRKIYGQPDKKGPGAQNSRSPDPRQGAGSRKSPGGKSGKDARTEEKKGPFGGLFGGSGSKAEGQGGKNGPQSRSAGRNAGAKQAPGSRKNANSRQNPVAKGKTENSRGLFGGGQKSGKSPNAGGSRNQNRGGIFGGSRNQNAGPKGGGQKPGGNRPSENRPR